MAKLFDGIDDALRDFVQAQPIFFVATAPLGATGLINCSPKGNRGEFAVVDSTRVAYLDQTGSGVETVAHLKENGRIVLMFCAMSGPPRIVRFHGTGHVVQRISPEFETLAPYFDRSDDVGVRCIISIDVHRVSDSCGYGVPLMEFTQHRPTMDQWAARKGPEGIAVYQSEKNRRSIDGLSGLESSL